MLCTKERACRSNGAALGFERNGVDDVSLSDNASGKSREEACDLSDKMRWNMLALLGRHAVNVIFYGP
ncbi:hypothetical protein GCM10007901_22240 [Dyella acidisoli]|uniref:Uncharacterized protein n=1 Tax=Dyella acidisoli TaxID=1867834 RepID=A0ABQ5XNV6_9GAMM|nr:hypothetical protein GCM10007901_22240 [Dyella acidisoli]